MRLTQDDLPSVSVSRMRALGEVREDMSRVRVTIAGVSREVRSLAPAFSQWRRLELFSLPIVWPTGAGSQAV